MSDLTLIGGDTAPPIDGVIRTAAGAVLPITDVTSVRFQMRRVGDVRYTVNAAAEIVDAATGKVRYVWAANDLDRPGEYETQWELTYDDESVSTTQPPNALTVRQQ